MSERVLRNVVASIQTLHLCRVKLLRKSVRHRGQIDSFLPDLAVGKTYVAALLPISSAKRGDPLATSVPYPLDTDPCGQFLPCNITVVADPRCVQVTKRF
jgi:hypothetical protein